MASKAQQQTFAEIVGITSMDKAGPFEGSAAVGIMDGYIVAVSWTTFDKKAGIGFMIRFRKGSLKLESNTLREKIIGSDELLQMMDKKSLSGAEKDTLTITEDTVLFAWQYSFRAPAAETAAKVARLLVKIIAEHTSPPGSDCQMCEKYRGDLYCIDGLPMLVCAGCRESMGEDDRKAIDAYEALPSNPVAGLIAGIIASVAMACAWGLVAYGLNRIFLYGAILIGVVVAWAVNKGMGKVNFFGQAITVILTLFSVIAGDYLFILLSAAKELESPIDLDLARLVVDHFVEIEFAEASGYLSMLFGVIGAVYILYSNRAPVAKRTMVPVKADVQPGSIG